MVVHGNCLLVLPTFPFSTNDSSENACDSHNPARMNGTIQNGPMTNGEDHLADDLQTWAANLADAAKAYKNASGQESLALRSKMTDTAKHIINAVKEPMETCFEHSVQVRIPPGVPSQLFAYTMQMAEMGALRMLMELKVFDKIPQQGSISYKELAEDVGAEESLLSKNAREASLLGSCVGGIITFCSSIPLDVGINWYIGAGRGRPDRAYPSFQDLR